MADTDKHRDDCATYNIRTMTVRNAELSKKLDKRYIAAVQKTKWRCSPQHRRGLLCHGMTTRRNGVGVNEELRDCIAETRRWSGRAMAVTKIVNSVYA